MMRLRAPRLVLPSALSTRRTVDAGLANNNAPYEEKPQPLLVLPPPTDGLESLVVLAPEGSPGSAEARLGAYNRTPLSFRRRRIDGRVPPLTLVELAEPGGLGATIGIMSEAPFDDPLVGWDPRRRAALERLWDTFAAAGGNGTNLSGELISKRRAEAEAEDDRPCLS